MNERTVAQLSSPRASLPSLPNEILTSIITYAGKATALSLARVSRRFTLLADGEIWRDLDLRLPQHYGCQPLVLPHARCEDKPYRFGEAFRAWEREETERVENRRRAGLKEKMKTLLLRMDARRATAVKAIKMVPRVGAVSAQIQILELASGSLESLRILSLEAGSASYYWPETIVTPQDTLDFRMIGSGLFLPALKHVVIESGSIYFAGFLSLLLNTAPNVSYLDIDRSNGYVDEGPEPSFAPLERDTKLEHLRIYSYDGDGMDDCEEDNLLVVTLLERSPLLRALALDLVEFSEPLRTQAISACNRLKHLRSVFMPSDMSFSKEYLGEGKFSCPVRRVAFAYGLWWHPLKHLPDLPTATTIFLGDDLDPAANMPLPAPYPEPIIPNSMIPSFATQLRRCPHLHAIYTAPNDMIMGDGGLGVFDRMAEIEKLRKPTITVRSIVHDGAELLHVRWLQQREELLEADHRDGEHLGEHRPLRFTFLAKDGSKRSKLFSVPGQASWYDYTDFDGHCVPLEILAEMRRVQGASQEEWVGRGIEVSEAAWRVLTDWRDGQEAQAEGRE